MKVILHNISGIQFFFKFEISTKLIQKLCYNWYKHAVSTANVLYCVICLIYCKCICTVSVLTTSKLYLYIDLPRLVHYFQSMIIVYQLCKNRNYKMSQINWWSFLLPKSIYKFSLSVLVSVCLFVSNKRENGWTDRAQIFCGTSRDHREGLWIIIKNVF